MIDTRSAHCLTIGTLASLTLAYGDRVTPLEPEARDKLKGALDSIRLILAWDERAQEAQDCPCSQDYTTDPQCCAAGECVRAAE